jgi:hypothetical protein
MQYFSGAGARHILLSDKYHLFGALVAGHFALAETDDLLII